MPALPGALELAEGGRGGCRRQPAQRRRRRRFADFSASVRPRPPGRSVADAMTSGGLLVAIDPGRAESVPGSVIGRLVAGEGGTILVR